MILPLTKYYTFILKDHTYLNFPWSCKYSPEGFKFKSKLDYATPLFTAFQWLLIPFKRNATPFPAGIKRNHSQLFPPYLLQPLPSLLCFILLYCTSLLEISKMWKVGFCHWDFSTGSPSFQNAISPNFSTIGFSHLGLSPSLSRYL